MVQDVQRCNRRSQKEQVDVGSRFSGSKSVHGVGKHKYLMATAVEQSIADIEKKTLKAEEGYRDSLKYCVHTVNVILTSRQHFTTRTS